MSNLNFDKALMIGILIVTGISRMVPELKSIRLLMLPFIMVYIYSKRVTYWWNILYEILILISIVFIFVGDKLFGEKVYVDNVVIAHYPVMWTFWLFIFLIVFYPILMWIMKMNGYMLLKSELDDYSDDSDEEIY